jgi:hypothetical protein
MEGRDVLGPVGAFGRVGIQASSAASQYRRICVVIGVARDGWRKRWIVPMLDAAAIIVLMAAGAS